MMTTQSSHSAAFYQVLFEGETLFQTGEPQPLRQNQHAKADTKAPVNEQITQIQSPVDASPPKKEVMQPAFPALKHHVLILTDNPGGEQLPETEHILLTNILKAVGLAPDKTDILNCSFLPSADARKVLSEKRTHFFITFGVPLIRLNLDLLLTPYTPKQTEGIWFLLADTLSTINTDKILKKNLWLALQKMFETA